MNYIKNVILVLLFGTILLLPIRALAGTLSYVGVGGQVSGTAGVNTATAALPANLNANDLLITVFQIYTSTAVTVITPPAGWTLWPNTAVVSNQSQFNPQTAIYYTTYSGSSPALTFTWTNGNFWSMRTLAVRDSTGGAPQVGAAVNAVSSAAVASLAAPAQTATENGDFQFVTFSPNTTSTSPAGLTNIFNDNIQAGDSGNYIILSSTTAAASYTGSWSSQTATAVSLLVKPAVPQPPQTVAVINFDLPATLATPTPTPSGATYYISPTGSDSNNGQSPGAPWLTPNHTLNCGDEILAAAGTYAEGNFRIGQWGTVTCAANNNVAWLKCSTFDTCKINITGSNDAMDPGKSYWGIQGWEITSAANNGNNQCINAFPTTVNIHHIIFANNIANGCGAGGITAGGNSGIGPDYVAMLGNIAYNAAQDSAHCYSGFIFITPTNADTASGTHTYIAGNFAWGNVDPNPCQGGLPTDGEGINLDTINGNGYTGQIVITNNIMVYNGAYGILKFSDDQSPFAPTFITNNTVYGNQTGGINTGACADLEVNFAWGATANSNLVQTGAGTGCHSGGPLYALAYTDNTPVNPSNSNVLSGNFLYSAAGNNTFPFSTFSYGSNITGTNPNFVNPVKPPAPNCSGKASVPDCMSTVISNYTPQNATALSYGRQPVSGTSIHDPLFPQWLCHVTDLPPGLITMGCS